MQICNWGIIWYSEYEALDFPSINQSIEQKNDHSHQSTQIKIIIRMQYLHGGKFSELMVRWNGIKLEKMQTDLHEFGQTNALLDIVRNLIAICHRDDPSLLPGIPQRIQSDVKFIQLLL